MQAGVALDCSAEGDCTAGQAVVPQVVQPVWGLQVQASSRSGAVTHTAEGPLLMCSQRVRHV